MATLEYGDIVTASALQQLIRHMEWADAAVWRAVLERQESHTDPITRTRLHHIHTVQRVYLGIWRGEPLELVDESAFPDLASICAWGRDYHVEATVYASSLDAADLEQTVEFPWAAQLAGRWGEIGPVTLAESVLQVTSHSTYHRGQVNARLRELGGEPPLVDFVAWLWQRRPAADWPRSVQS